MAESFEIEGLDDLLANLANLPKATERNACIRAMKVAAEPVAATWAQLAPHASGRLAFSISIGTQLTRRHRGEQESQFEVYIGPAGGLGTLQYAEEEEFGWRFGAAQPSGRPAWESKKAIVLEILGQQLWSQIEAAATRRATKLARAAAAAGG